MRIDLEGLTRQEVYRLLCGAIMPRPIALISTINSTGMPNLAPFSFFAPISPVPPWIAIAFGSRNGEKKDTVRNIEFTRDFVVNVVTEDIAGAMNASSASFPPDVSEFAEVGLTAQPSDFVSSPRVAESPINLECVLKEAIEVGEPPHFTNLIIAEVVSIHVRDDLLSNGSIDALRLLPVGRLNGDLYCRVRDAFSMPRPADPACETR